MELGDVTRRRRIYIAVIHESVLRRGINSNARLEEELNKTIDSLKVVGKPPNPPPSSIHI